METTTWTVLFPMDEPKVGVDKRQLCKWFPEFKKLMRNFGDIVELKIETLYGIVTVVKEGSNV